ncbi:hypothetical protein EGO58_12025 [Limosilactobacillus reuteri]|uniref:Uncharacterized protein n=2 Tax=Bifidobacterium TaxID=1678 RepID=A0A7J5TMI0_BIFBI|nr:hypothetical protein BALAC2494_01632 [Bifidobacterium animalis subsp. lactis CNCM I-2494]AXM93188.1 hypothetical protein CJD49_02345 [Bifidobacterium animalis subsp. lactis]KAB5633241.1 hypothetical protein GBA51_04540 [Bifidobacterium animalis]KAB7478032.1 hypothetical protein GBA86_10140 [Bifidobacterium bifidum]PIN32222.1 hypothetical protein CUC13_02710 [Bifidobacterium animalis subsp. lactis BB-12]ROV58502.1 hypothetical protein EGO58_12025 [Limosilactobacillus reuteri]
MLCQSETRLAQPTSRTDTRERRTAYHTEDSVQYATDSHLNGSICGSIRRIRRECTPRRHISRNLPNNLPERCPEMACFAEPSESSTAESTEMARHTEASAHRAIAVPCKRG